MLSHSIVITRGLFWSSSDILYNVDEICDYADKYLYTAVGRKKKPRELDLLQQAIKHAYGLSSSH